MLAKYAEDPTFEAMAEMCGGLFHPMDHSRNPDRIELFDIREVFWHPTGDRRQVWLLKYTYQREDHEPKVHLGKVGYKTFSMGVRADKSRVDIYGLNCCLGLHWLMVLRAPEKRDGLVVWQMIVEAQE